MGYVINFPEWIYLTLCNVIKCRAMPCCPRQADAAGLPSCTAKNPLKHSGEAPLYGPALHKGILLCEMPCAE